MSIFQLGIGPIGWANDDLRGWGPEVTAAQIMHEMAAAGYTGSEMSYLYPQDSQVLKTTLQGHGLVLAAAYHWTNLSKPDLLTLELERACRHVDFCAAAGARYAIFAEGGGSLHWDSAGPRNDVQAFSDTAWACFAGALNELGAYAASKGIQACIHPHAGTAVERQPEIERLLSMTESSVVHWCLDTGHAALGEVDTLDMIARYGKRIRYVHVKDVRPDVVGWYRSSNPLFTDAIRANVFGVPGQGHLNFAAILSALREAGYKGWLIVEGDQNPNTNPAFEVAQSAHRFLTSLINALEGGTLALPPEAPGAETPYEVSGATAQHEAPGAIAPDKTAEATAPEETTGETAPEEAAGATAPDKTAEATAPHQGDEVANPSIDTNTAIPAPEIEVLPARAPSRAGRAPLRIAVLGAGRIGALHAENVARAIPGAALAAVMDADIERARAAALQGYATDEFERILDDRTIDAVLIASPTDQHADQMIAAAHAGKAIFCEKPVSLDLAKATAALRAVSAAGVPFQIGFQRRYDHGFAAARKQMEAGAIGRLEMFRALTCDPEPAPFSYLAGSGGIYADMAIHDIDIARFYGGNIVEVNAMGAALIVPELTSVGDVDTSILMLRFASGAVGVIQNSRRATYGYEIRTELLGSDGKLVIEEESATPVRIYNKTGIHADFHGWFVKRFRQAYQDEVAAFVKAVYEGHTPSPGVADALQSLRVALAATRSLQTGTWVRVAEVQ